MLLSTLRHTRSPCGCPRTVPEPSWASVYFRRFPSPRPSRRSLSLCVWSTVCDDGSGGGSASNPVGDAISRRARGDALIVTTTGALPLPSFSLRLCESARELGHAKPEHSPSERMPVVQPSCSAQVAVLDPCARHTIAPVRLCGMDPGSPRGLNPCSRSIAQWEPAPAPQQLSQLRPAGHETKSARSRARSLKCASGSSDS